MSTTTDTDPGVTTSERFLARLCSSSFLSLWSYPSLYRDRNKELADLIVVFGEHVVFSDKNCRFDEASPHGWTRWRRRAIEESAVQLFRADGWLRNHRERIFLDAKCGKKFPFPLPAKPRIHLVAVALGATAACRNAFPSGSGSLIVQPSATPEEPFRIGDLDVAKPLVHVFDDVTLPLVLTELDTVADFVQYLDRKEALLRSGRLLCAIGEEDLLAYYLTHTDAHGFHDFVFPGATDEQILLSDHWPEFRYPFTC